MTAGGVRLSVVLACARDSAPSGASLEAVRAACRGIAAEVIVAHGAGVEVAEGDGAPPLRRVAGSPDALVPELWGLGIEAASGQVVALTIPECQVSPEWAQRLLSVIGEGVTGAGGGFVLAAGADLVTRAAFFLRYSAFLPPAASERRQEIAGDNAAYEAGALRRHRRSLAHGFWEVEFHRLIRADGAVLMLVPGSTATFRGPIRFAGMWRQRLEHGRRFAAWRVREGGAARWRIVCAAPLVPAMLVARVLRRLRGRPGMIRQALPALPVVFVLAVAWAAGEATGAWRAERVPLPTG
jgi:hypothetical protein